MVFIILRDGYCVAAARTQHQDFCVQLDISVKDVTEKVVNCGIFPVGLGPSGYVKVRKLSLIHI